MKTLSVIAVIITALFISAQTASANCGSCEADVKQNVEKATAAAQPSVEKATATAQPSAVKAADVEKKPKLQKLCLKCGMIKSSEKCCEPGQNLCKKCDLVKDSLGCCKIPKNAKAAYYNPDTKKVTIMTFDE